MPIFIIHKGILCNLNLEHLKFAVLLNFVKNSKTCYHFEFLYITTV